MNISPLAGKLPPASLLVNLPRLVSAYYTRQPDVNVREQRVAFGTSGHRGSALKTAFNEAHILGISQAISLYRAQQGVTGPLFLGMDTHALSEPAFNSAIEVFAANGVGLRIDPQLGYTPTPAISHAILTHNRGRTSGLADGVVITPSHNPPEDGGFKYNPPHGGPADSNATKWIEEKANAFLADGLREVKRISFERALKASSTQRHDYLRAYVEDLASVIDFEVIRGAKLDLAVDPLGGAGVAYWPAIEDHYKIGLRILNPDVDATFRFMTMDWDGKIRMDCSSPYAMAGLIALRDKFDVAWGNDTDHDRHGIVAGSAGLLNPNHYLAVAIRFLFQHRPNWAAKVGIGKTLVSSSMIDRVAAKLGRRMVEVPVGFKWFVDGLMDGSLGFVGEESAGATFLRRDGTVWTTDKDGLIPGLLAAELTAKTGRDPGEQYRELEKEFGAPVYERIDATTTPEQKAILARLSPEQVQATELGGDKITAKLTKAPGNGAPVGGLKVTTDSGWFAARPSGTEDVYKIYAESFRDRDHLRRIQQEAQHIVSAALSAAGAHHVP